MLSSIGSSVDNGLLSLSVAPYDDVRNRKLRDELSSGCCFVEITCGSFDLVDEGLKVFIDNVRDVESVLVIMESEFVLAFFRHLYSDGAMSDTSTVGFVLFEKVLSRVSV